MQYVDWCKEPGNYAINHGGISAPFHYDSYLAEHRL